MQLPSPLERGDLRFWRIDAEQYASTWYNGEGSFLSGGRWNSKGVRAVYTSLDPATTILELAVHKGFQVLDTKPHILTSARIIDEALVHVVRPDDIPNPNWLTPCTPNRNQQAFGDKLMQDHTFVCIPSVVSKNSWNLIFDAEKTVKHYDDIRQERLSIDPRLQPLP